MKNVPYVLFLSGGVLVKCNYKIRRGTKEREERNLCICFFERENSPVSYTHLDVYKRQGKKDEANRKFALIVIFGVAVGILFAVASNIFASPIVRMLGASDVLFENCLIYLRILNAFAPCLLYTSRCV